MDIIQVGLITRQNASIPVEKILGYVLNKSHPVGKHKAIVFESVLGYNESNYQELINIILDNLDKYPAIFKGKNNYGENYEVTMEITGPTGRLAKVVTAWFIYYERSSERRLVSAYVQSN